MRHSALLFILGVTQHDCLKQLDTGLLRLLSTFELLVK